MAPEATANREIMMAPIFVTTISYLCAPSCRIGALKNILLKKYIHIYIRNEYQRMLEPAL